jgi:exonuclease VII large subunit
MREQVTPSDLGMDMGCAQCLAHKMQRVCHIAKTMADASRTQAHLAQQDLDAITSRNKHIMVLQAEAATAQNNIEQQRDQYETLLALSKRNYLSIVEYYEREVDGLTTTLESFGPRSTAKKGSVTNISSPEGQLKYAAKKALDSVKRPLSGRMGTSMQTARAVTSVVLEGLDPDRTPSPGIVQGGMAYTRCTTTRVLFEV